MILDQETARHRAALPAHTCRQSYGREPCIHRGKDLSWSMHFKHMLQQDLPSFRSLPAPLNDDHLGMGKGPALDCQTSWLGPDGDEKMGCINPAESRADQGAAMKAADSSQAGPVCGYRGRGWLQAL